MKLINNTSVLNILIILLLSFLSVRALFSPGFFPMHDDTQVARVFEMRKSLADGMLPVRWTQDLGYGYGYPIFNFYAPLAYYTGAAIDLVVNDSLLSTKVMIAIGILLSCVTMYFLAKEFWGSSGAILSALLYVYAPYHAVNVYVRGAVAETYGYAFIPLTLYGFYKIYQQPRWKHIILASIGYAGVILSHNLTALMLTPFIIGLIITLCWVSPKDKRPRANPYLLYAFIFSLLLSAFYWIPSLAEMKYTNVISQVGGGADYKDHFVCLSQLWDSTWGFGGSTPTCIDGLSFRIGKIHLLLGAITIVGLLFIKKSRLQKIAALMGFGVILISILLMTNASKSIWDTFSPMAYLQYPWRFLVMTSCAVSFLGGGILYVLRTQTFLKINKNIYVGFVSVMIVTILFFYAKLFLPQYTISATNEKLTSKEYINWTVSKISDEYMPKYFVKPQSAAQVPNGMINNETTVSTKQSYNGVTHKLVATQSEKAGRLGLNLAYFPGWKFLLDGRDFEPQINKGKYIFKIPAGTHTLKAIFVSTAVENIANVLSLSGFSLLLVGIIISRKKKAF